MDLLRIPTAVQPMTGIEGFKYQASDGKDLRFIFLHPLRLNREISNSIPSLVKQKWQTLKMNYFPFC